MVSENLEARLIIEIMGRPPKHMMDTFHGVLDKLSQEKGVTIINKIVHEPVKIKDSKNLFTSFAEIDAEFDSIRTFFGIIFAYMPANIEIIEPQNMKITNSELNELVNLLTNRLHLYDSINKQLLGERDILLNKLNLTITNNINKEDSKIEKKKKMNNKK